MGKRKRKGSRREARYPLGHIALCPKMSLTGKWCSGITLAQHAGVPGSISYYSYLSLPEKWLVGKGQGEKERAKKASKILKETLKARRILK